MGKFLSRDVILHTLLVRTVNKEFFAEFNVIERRKAHIKVFWVITIQDLKSKVRLLGSAS